jgi:hypothetical protein
MFLRILQVTFDRHRKGEVILRGTDISKSDHDWTNNKFPVMYFDLSKEIIGSIHRELVRFQKMEEIHTIPEECVYKLENQSGPTLPPEVVQKFSELLCAVKGRTVVLVDEYDHSILAYGDNKEILEKNTNLLKSFFHHFKTDAVNIQLAFVTGLTKSLYLLLKTPYADLNDISEDKNYDELAGITEKELNDYFEPEINSLAKERNVKPGAIKEELRNWYNGYRFSLNSKRVYRP